MIKPKKVKLTYHARLRLDERKKPNNYYNTKNLMKSSCKWFTKEDFIEKSALYLHSLYVCRKSRQMGYLTDGNIEVLYNKSTGIAITVLKLKEKFLPINRYIKPEIIEHINKRERAKMKIQSSNKLIIFFKGEKLWKNVCIKKKMKKLKQLKQKKAKNKIVK